MFEPDGDDGRSTVPGANADEGGEGASEEEASNGPAADMFATETMAELSARQGRVPDGDASTYGDIPNGDDPANGNGAHPSIKNSTAGTDFEEDGERVWDVMRAVDFAQSLPSVNPNRVLVGGLSLGGEVAGLAA